MSLPHASLSVRPLLSFSDPEHTNFTSGKMKPYAPGRGGPPNVQYSMASVYRHSFRKPQTLVNYDVNMPTTRFGSTTNHQPAVGIGKQKRLLFMGSIAVIVDISLIRKACMLGQQYLQTPGVLSTFRGTLYITSLLKFVIYTYTWWCPYTLIVAE